MKRLLPALLLLALPIATALAAEWTLLETLEPADLSWSGEGESMRLDFPGAAMLESTGRRALPGRFIRVPLPEGERLADFSFESSSPVNLGSGRLPGALGPVLREDGLRASVRGASEGEVIFLGQDARRGKREAVFYWRPLYERGGELLLSGRLELRLVSELDPDPPLRVLRGDRGEAASGFRTGERPSLGDSPVDAVIITTEEMAPAFETLADWHLSRGSRCLVRTVEWIAVNYPIGADLGEQVRSFLQEAYQLWGLESVLLGGDTPEIPARYMAYEKVSGGEVVVDELIPSDLYYSCLDGNWNADGDHLWAELEFYGEPSDDADLLPELLVGRIPVSTLADAQGIVDKLIAYRERPADAGFQDRILFLAEVLFPDDWPADEDSTINGTNGDGAYYVSKIIDNYLTPEMEYTCLFQNWVDPRWAAYSPQAETVASSLERMQTGDYAFVDHNGHGYRYNMSVGDGNITTDHARQLENPNLFHITLMNCTSTAFDFECLGETYLRNPLGGAVSVFGTTRKSFPIISEVYYNRFYEALFGGQTRPARIFDEMRQDLYLSAYTMNLQRWTYFIVTYLGDPLMDLWAGDPIVYAVTAPSEIGLGPATVEIHVDAEGGGAVEGARVTLRKDGEVWTTGLTDASGDLSFEIQPTSAGEIELCAWGPNGVMHRSSITAGGDGGAFAAVESWSLDDDPAFGAFNDGDGVEEAGEVLRLNMDIRNSGAGGLSGALLDLVSLHDSIIVTDGHENLPTIPAGGVVEADELEFSIAAGLMDGQQLPLLLTLGAPGQDDQVDTLIVQISAPLPRIARWTLSDALPDGDGDGIIEPGESFRAAAEIINLGRADTGLLSLDLHRIGAGSTLSDSLEQVASLEQFETASSTPGFLLSLDDPSIENLAWLEIRDARGRVRRDTLDFLPPAAPSAPVAQISSSSTRVEILWEPNSEEDLQGYHVYLAVGEPSSFERYTQVPVPHASMVLDGLPESSAIHCYLTAVDEGGLESAASGVLDTATNPSLNPGFPQELQAPSTSSLAIGSISSTGGLEIVVGADDYLYAFQYTGQEVQDGDANAQIPGIFSIAAEHIVGAVTLVPPTSTDYSQIYVASRGGGTVGIHRLDHHGEELPGWPQATVNWIWANMAAGDLDGDGDLEIVGMDISGYLYAFHHDGSELVDGDSNPSTNGVIKSGLGNWYQGGPALYDLDGVGGAEIIITDAAGALHAIQADGSELPNFPVAPTGGCKTKAPILVADLNDDTSMEIVVLAEEDQLFVFTADGQNFPGFPVYFESFNQWDPGPGAAPCDVDGDGQLELFIVGNRNFGSDCLLRLIDNEANDLDGWPVSLDYYSYASPVVGDVDGDGDLEFIVGCEDGIIYGFNEDGSTQDGFPLIVNAELRGTPSLADIDQDGDVELIASTWSKRQLYAWDFPGAWSDAAFPWPTVSGNYRRTGVFKDRDEVPVLLEGLSLTPLLGAVRLEWNSDSPELRSWSLQRERRLESGQWGEAEWVFRETSFAGGMVTWEDADLEGGATYRYEALAHLENGNEERFYLGSVELPAPAWIDRLHGAYPNPFNPTTTLLFEMSEEGPARIEIFSVDGRRLRTLVDERLAAGRHERLWNGRDDEGRGVASGIYLARFIRPGLSESKRLVLLK